MSRKRKGGRPVEAAPKGQEVAVVKAGESAEITANSRAPDARQFAILGEMVYREMFARRFGMQYDGDRNIAKVGGYPREIKFEHMAALYDRDPLAGRGIDMVAETTWRRPPEVIEVDAKGNAPREPTEFMRAWTKTVKRLHIWNRLERADKLARLGRYSVLLIGTNAVDQNFERPLSRVIAPSGEDGRAAMQVLYLSCYSEAHAKIASWVEDPRNERFGLPATYMINLSAGAEGFKANTLNVHHSHCLHIADGVLEDDVYGRPVLRRVYNDLIDLQKIKTSAAEAYWQIVAGILQAKIDPNANIDETQLRELDKQLQDIYHDLKRTFYGQGVELQRLAGNDPQPKGASDLSIKMIAAGFETPFRVLIGNETGERASTEDMDAYYGVIAERRINFAEPVILRPLIDLFIDIGALPRPESGEYQIVWPALHEESEREVAEANKLRAEAAAALTAVGGSPLDLVEIDQDRNVWLRPTGERGQLTPDELEPPDLTSDESGVEDTEAEPAADEPAADDEEQEA